MRKLFFLCAAIGLTIAACGGDPSTERNYNNKTSTTGDDPNQPEYNEQNDPVNMQTDSANRGKVNNDPNGVNTPQK